MLSSRVRGVTPYTPGEQPSDRSYIKLNTNENPYPASPRIARLLSEFDVDRLRRYPDPLFVELREAASKRHGIAPECVFAGNGSDEVLSFAHFAFFDSVAFPSPSYSFYPVYCDFYGIRAHSVPLDDSFEVDLDALSDAETDGIVIANPNTPTGIHVPRLRLESLLESYPADRVVVVDEAYIDFGGESCVPLIDRFPNLLVVHTLSKSASLAGLRLGLAYGQPRIIETLFTAKDAFNSYPVHELAQRIGTLVFEEEAYYRGNCERVAATRDRTSTELERRGWGVIPSMANFILASHPSLAGERIYRELRSRGILVRFLPDAALERFVRITIGTDTEMDAFLREATGV